MGRDLDRSRAHAPHPNCGRRSLTGLYRRPAGVFLFAALALAFAPKAQGQTTAPEDVTAAVQSDTSVKVTWDPPTQTLNGAAVSEYQRRHRPTAYTGSWFFVSGYDDSDRETTFQGLGAGTSYDFEVRACTSAIHCGAWGAATATTTGTPADGPSLLARDAGDGSAQLRITFPSSGSDVLQDGDPIRIEYKKTETASWTGAAAKASTHPTQVTTISGLEVGASYDFRARGTSSWGDTAWSDVATVAGKPGSPGSFAAATSPTHGSVDLSWNTPTNTGGKPITGYTINWRPHTTANASSNWLDAPSTGTSNVGPSATSINLGSGHGLDPSTTYSFRISATNANRRSFWTPGDGSVAAATSAADPNAPPGKVPNVQATADSATQITFTWDEPTTGGTFGWYRFHTKVAGTTNWANLGGQAHTQPRSQVNRNRHPGTTYEYRIRACKTSAETDCGEWSDTASATTLYHPPNPPQNFAASALNDDNNGTDRLTWDPPANTGVTGYSVIRRPQGESLWETEVSVTDTSHDYAKAPGNSGSAYEYRVRSDNPNGTSHYTPLVTVAGRPGTPNVAATPSASAVAVTLAWTPPSDGGKALSDYRVEWRQDATGDWTANPAQGHTTAPGNASSVTVYGRDGLQVNTAYDFRVRADNPDRSSFYSAEAMATTVDIGANISSTSPTTLKEGSLHGATLTVDLVGATYAQSLQAGHFQFTPLVTGLSVASVNRVDDDTAVLTLAYAWTDAAMTSDSNLAVVVGAAATTASSLTSNAVTVGHFVNTVLTVAPASRALSVTEGDAAAITLSLSEPVPLAVEVDWRVASGTATAGDDFAAHTNENTSQAVNAGDTSVTITVPTVEDQLDENAETFSVVVNFKVSTTPAPLIGKLLFASLLSEITSTVTILDDDPLPEVSASAPRVTEGDSGTTTPMTFTFTLSPASGRTVTVDTGVIPGTAEEGVDYARAPLEELLTFTAGETSKDFVVTVNGDDTAEPDETVVARFGPLTNAAFASGAVKIASDAAEATGTIENDDTAPTTIDLTLDPASVGEADGATTVTVTAAFPADGDTLPTDAAVSVAVGAATDGATEGTDYATVNDLTVTISANARSGTATFTLTPTNDSDSEGNETITVSGTASGFTVDAATLTIADDDIPPTTTTLNLSSDSVAEGGTTTLRVTLAGRTTTGETTVTVTPPTGGEFTAQPASRTIAVGGTTATFTLRAANDRTDAPDRTVEVAATVASGAGDAVQTPDPVQLTVTDNDPTPRATLALDRITISENGGVATVTATLDRPSSEATTLTVSADPAAGANPAETGDFTLSGTTALTVAAGDAASTGTVTVTANDDADSLDERVTVSATAQNDHGITAPAAVTLTIEDADVPGFALGALSGTLNEGGTAAYTVVLNVQPSADVAVRVRSDNADVTVGADAATAGRDHTLTFTPGNWDTARTVTVAAAEDDDAADDAATLTHGIVDGASAAEYRPVADRTLDVTVDDDDTAGFTIDTDPDTAGVQSGAVVVDEGGSATWTLVLDAAPARGSVRIAVKSDDTTSVTVAPSSLTFTAANWAAPRTVAATGRQDGDSIGETVAVTHAVDAAASADEYDGVADATVTVNVSDDETTNYDGDGDGLIEIHTLAQLNAVRWDLDGDGTASAGNEADYAAAFVNPANDAVCPAGATCAGYELAADLDFDENGDGAITSADAAHWNGGEGWAPIGGSVGYGATFDGNGRTVANLFVNRGGADRQGLFGRLGDGGAIRNVGLVNAKVTGRGRVGALAGHSTGSVVRSYAIGAVVGADNVGGLVGENGAGGSVAASYAAATVTGGREAGGLVGQSDGEIRDSYAVGRVLTDSGVSVSGNGTNVGGLVGRMDGSASLRASYASVDVRNPVNPGSTAGLVGWRGGGSVENSYYDTDTTPDTDASTAAVDTVAVRNAGSGVTNVSGRSAAELKAPTAATGIYAAWGADWDFGTASQYPALKADLDGDSAATWEEFGFQIREAPVFVRAVAAPDLGAVDLEWVAATDPWTARGSAPVVSYALRRDGTRIAPAEAGTLADAAYADDTVVAGQTYSYEAAVLVFGAEVRRGAPVSVAVTRDADGDGLIEIRTAAQLDAMRHDLDGDGTVDDAADAAAFAPLAPAGGSACPSGTTCTGYELANDIALSGAWTPIGGNVPDDSEEPSDPGDNVFAATFDGNGGTIRGLRVELPNSNLVGLFGATRSGSEIRDVGLQGVDVRGSGQVGALVGRNDGAVRRVWASGKVAGNAHVGGLVGGNPGTIETSYSIAAATGVSAGGAHSVRTAGLVGQNQGAVRDAYAAGAVSSHGHAAGLAGWNDGTAARIARSYAAGPVSSAAGIPAGGLVGWQSAGAGSITASYWDTEATGQAEGAAQGEVPAGAGRTTDALQSPTAATGIYADWSGAVWDFGTAEEYPALKADYDGDGTATWEEFGYQRGRTPPDDDDDADGDGDGSPGGGSPGGGGGGGGGGGTPNRAPETAQPIGDRTLKVNAALQIDLSDAFEDADGDGLEYTATTADAAVATVEVDGDTLTVRAAGRGAVEITATATDADGETISQTFMVAVTGPEAVWYLPPASDPARQGFVRVVNHTDADGEARIDATDDAGVDYEALTLALCARCVSHFNSDDLELGNPAKGLSGATGPGTGGWRLAIESETLDLEALAYMRTADGFLTAMQATAPIDAEGVREAVIFNPGSNVDQVSLLRLVNAGTEEAQATVTGVDDAGRSPGEPVRLALAAGTACTVDGAQLESGAGLACGRPQAGLGDGAGKWRLTVAADVPLVAMSLLSSPGGYLTNLSAKAPADADGVWRANRFPAASDPHGRQGFVRVINRSDTRGSVTVRAFDDSDVEYEPLTLALGAGETAHFNSDDLEGGNRSKGLTGSTGAGVGSWRLAFESEEIAFEALAYVRTDEGFLTAMQGVAPVEDRVHRVAIFNPGSNANQVSALRLVNPGTRSVGVSITGTDDRGARPGTTVRIIVPAGDAVEVTAAALESGEHDAIRSGALGGGTGKWRLRVEADRFQDRIAVMSLLSSPTGHLTNLSRADAARGFERTPAALLAPPDTVALETAGERRLRASWSAVEGARYAVDLLRDGQRDDDRSLTRATRTSFSWSSLAAGTYTVRACSVNEDGECGAWSAESDEVGID
ncbi:MAG: fibronectin type III domain-containing protein [Gammaproteobacteria bacterium]|nr:fibronectin type III domain-containing protein [Gammaproteobacteria bacterium]